jgi:PKD repeat protein
MATDAASPEAVGTAAGNLVIGPAVTLTSDIFPPVLTLSSGQASLTFQATASSGTPPYSYAWDLDGDGQIDPGSDPSASTASFTYAGAGKFEASVTVTDDCGLSATDTLAVVVFDPEAACHPRAQQIAQAIDSLFPGQAGDLYTCEDIFGMFNGDLTGSQLGFGRMWHAYQMALSIEELTWEEILDWQLGGNGWGLLAQIDRYAEVLDEIDTRQLYEMVMSGEASVQDIRTAARAAVQTDADFEDALARLSDGTSPGELLRFYRTAEDLGVDTATLDTYLDDGQRLSDISHAGQVASRFDVGLDAIVGAHAEGHSWGEINQAYRLADDETSAEEILAAGTQASRQQQQGTNLDEPATGQDAHLAEQLARRYGMSVAEIEALAAECGGDWGCVRDQLRNRQATGTAAAQDDDTAQRLASQYGVGVDRVWTIYNGSCGGDWGCVRKTLRGDSRPGKH